MRQANIIRIPRGGRICYLTIKTKDYRWQQAIDTIAPDTRKKDKLYGVGRLFSKPKSDAAEEDLVLLNFPHRWGQEKWEDVLKWARRYSLRLSDPRHVFAIWEQHESFFRDHFECGCTPVWSVVATKSRTYEGTRCAFDMTLVGKHVGAGIDPVDYYAHCNYTWLVFRRPRERKFE